MNGSYTGVSCNNIILISCMNVWLGKRMNDSFNEIFLNNKTMELNTSNEKYKELINKTRHGNPTTYVTKESIPTICIYGGKDGMDGVMQYSLLEEEFNKYDNPNISLIYFKNGTHHSYTKTEYNLGKEIIPTICLYGGKDEMDGVMQYSLLEEKFNEHNNPNITLVYFKKGTHNVLTDAEGEYGEKIIARLNQVIKSNFQKYLDSYNKNK